MKITKVEEARGYVVTSDSRVFVTDNIKATKIEWIEVFGQEAGKVLRAMGDPIELIPLSNPSI